MQYEKDEVLRLFGAVLTPGALDRHWSELVRRHQLSGRNDIRVSAFEYLLEVGVVKDPVVVEESSLREAEAMAFRDPLTGLFNYRYFQQQLRTELARSERYRSPLCLILVDLDGFKRVNDRFGHGVGNAVLRDVAHVLGRGLRDGDVVARLGGDEFAILVHQSSERAGLLIAERKRRAIEDWFLANTYRGVSVNVTASFGVAMVDAPTALPDLFDDADRALYQAKEHGRNRVLLSLVGWEWQLSGEIEDEPMSLSRSHPPRSWSLARDG